MKKLSIRFFAMVTMLLCASSMAFAAVDWSKYEFIADGAGDGKYTNKYKVETVEGLQVVNIQHPGFAEEDGIYMNLPAGITSCSVASAIQGAGVLIYLSALTALETEVTIKYDASKEITFHIYYADGGGAKKDNVVLNEAAYASSGTASLGNDGNAGTRWESEATDNQWWLCKMAEESEFNTVQIVWEGAYAKSFKLEVSNDSTNWTEIANIQDQTLAGFPYTQTITVGDQKAKYLRFVGVARATGYGYSFWELRAFEKKTPVLTTIELKAEADIVKVGETVKLTTATKDQDGENIEAEVTYTVTPAEAGTVENGIFTAAQFGNATITATSGSVSSAPVSVFCYTGENVALSTNIDTDNKVIAQSEFAPDGTNAFFAVDGNDGSVWQGSATNGTADTEEARTYDAWFVLDLGAFYNVNLVSIKFEGACSQAYHLDFSANNKDWNLAYNYVGNAGINGHTDLLYGDKLANAQSVRYVRFFSTKAATAWGMKMYEMKVFAVPGTAPEDTEKPVMGTATLVSNDYAQAVVAVSATDNMGIAFYHVLDATNGIDAKYAPVNGNITITGLTPATTYNFTISALDLIGNESDNTATLSIKTLNYPAAPAIPTHAQSNVRSIYSDSYTSALAHAFRTDNWESPLGQEVEVNGNHYYVYNMTANVIVWGNNNDGEDAIIAAEGFNDGTNKGLDLSSMEKLHFDLWLSEDCVGGVVLINDDRLGEMGALESGKWVSVDMSLDGLSTDKLTNLRWMKFDGFAGVKTVFIDNVYAWKSGTTTLTGIVTTGTSACKRMINGQLVIIRDGVRYNAQGQIIQ